MFRIFDLIWKNGNLDLRMNVYNVVMTGYQEGLVQVFFYFILFYFILFYFILFYFYFYFYFFNFILLSLYSNPLIIIQTRRWLVTQELVRISKEKDMEQEEPSKQAFFPNGWRKKILLI